MPIVKRERRHIRIGGQIIEFIQIVKFSSKGNIFTIDLPPEWAKILNNSYVHGKTLPEAENAFKEAGIKYEQSNRVTTKVILYEFMTYALIRDGKGGIERAICSKNHFLPGVGLAVSAGIFDEHKATFSDGQVRYTYTEVEQLMSTGMSNDRKIPTYGTAKKEEPQMIWTVEREKFFRQLDRQLCALVEKMEEFCGDQNELLKHIDAGHLLMAPREENHGRNSETVDRLSGANT